ncbi:hypothetical protein Tco_1153863 [Tanacetum coccineum]
MGHENEKSKEVNGGQAIHVAIINMVTCFLTRLWNTTSTFPALFLYKLASGNNIPLVEIKEILLPSLFPPIKMKESKRTLRCHQHLPCPPFIRQLPYCIVGTADPIVALKVLKRESTRKNKLYLKIGLHVRLRFYKLCCFTPKLDSFLRGTSRGSTPTIMDAVSVYWEIGKTDQGLKIVTATDYMPCLLAVVLDFGE